MTKKQNDHHTTHCHSHSHPSSLSLLPDKETGHSSDLRELFHAARKLGPWRGEAHCSFHTHFPLVPSLTPLEARRTDGQTGRKKKLGLSWPCSEDCLSPCKVSPEPRLPEASVSPHSFPSRPRQSAYGWILHRGLKATQAAAPVASGWRLSWWTNLAWVTIRLHQVESSVRRRARGHLCRDSCAS